MLQRIVSFIVPNYDTLRSRKVFMMLLGLSLFLRFPFFFRDYIDRDESTFILMAQSWVDGFLPYTQLWDLKPPITFLLFVVIIKVLGKSILMIRFFGSVLVALTGFFTFKIGLQLTNKRVGFWIAILCVVLQSMLGSVQGVMSEHISILPFCIALYILLLKKQWHWYFISGLLIGISVMSKLNMVYPAFLLGLFLLYESIKKRSLVDTFPKLLVWILGMVLIIIFTALPYYLEGMLSTWWQSVFMAPLAYSSTKNNSILNVLPFCAILVSLLILLFRFKLLNLKKRNVQLLLAVIGGVVFSFVQTGKVNGHYLIQLYPFLLILVGIALDNLESLKKLKIAPILIFMTLASPIEAYSEYVNIIKNKIDRGTFYNGEGFTIPGFIKENNLDAKNIFFTAYHIGYWLLDENPPTKASTHPSNITRQELFPFMENPRKTSIEELQFIFENVRPKLVVTKKNHSIFDKEFYELNEYINSYLQSHYKEIAIIEKGIIYERLD